ncbi:MAG: lamin tail domain-containing protein [Actinomycetota bacterium]
MILSGLGRISLSIALILSAALFAGCGILYEPETGNAPQTGEDQCMVEYVIDGDTLVAGGRRVRLLGINTPEEGQYFYEESRQALMVMVDGKAIRMEKDITDKDRYGRLLRYIYLGDLFVNLEMVKRGFANTYTYPPDVAYQEMLVEAERYAREKNLGLWAKSDYGGIEVSINYDAPGDDRTNLNGEYVVLRNVSGERINLAGWTIKDMATSIYRFPNFVLGDGKEVYIHSGEGKDSGNRLYWGSKTPVWNNDGDTLYLRDRDGALVSIYSY